ncbi:MAG: dipeptide ABC transporter ATP-binding protein [Oscillibacter sp.]|nr:dipeptide ABC transporter ATP-binding protein [Oscillibacter sp.]
MAADILKIEHLKQYYPVRKGLFGKTAYVKALDDVTFSVKDGDVFGIVGESGCGKSTMGLTICKLIKPTDGSIELDGEDITWCRGKHMRSVRRKIQMVFQDPYASLNPRMNVRQIIEEPMIIHNLCPNKKEREERVVSLLRQVGLDDYHANRYPHQFSGGQRQRIGIARALAVDPKVIIADEPVSALDVSIQSQVLNLLADLKEARNLTYLFIAHDLSVVEHISDQVGVMYLGNFVEVAGKEELYSNPMHPYTQALLSAVPVPDPEVKRQRIILQGNIPSPMNAPSGCKFHPRCAKCMQICKEQAPPKVKASPDHYLFCHLYA